MRPRVGWAVLLATLAVGSQAWAQYVSPPYSVPPSTGYYYPVQPGGFVTGNPSPYPYPGVMPAPMPVVPITPYPGTPYYDPNARVTGTSSAMTYWDPARGWVTNTGQTSVLNSAYSPGRGPMPGTAIQNYNYWNGYQWVQGQRWLGADGLWHGVNTDTAVNPTGGTSSNTTVYSIQQRRNPDGTISTERVGRQVPR
jgi:hypothetical protein